MTTEPDANPPEAVAGRASPGKLAILYDGACELCRASMEAIRHFDASEKIELLNLHDPGVRARFPGLELKDLLEELHAVDDRGDIYTGARAINEILRKQPGIRGWLAYAWYIPGYAWLAERQYRRIAANRYRHGHDRSPEVSKAPEQR
jgi:predicted DCC family thiol-disulfide oxidoreductase YuxK